MNRYKDFDRHFEEQGREPVVIRLFGEDWHLPASVPMKPVVMMMRVMEERGQESELTPQESMNFLRDLVGEEVFDAWLERGIDNEQITEILYWALEQYGLNEDGENVDPTVAKARQLSNIGESSKPTSNESLASTLNENPLE